MKWKTIISCSYAYRKISHTRLVACGQIILCSGGWFVNAPVPDWCKQHSAGTLRLPWPSSEWPAPGRPSRKPPARSRLQFYTVRDKRRRERETLCYENRASSSLVHSPLQSEEMFFHYHVTKLISHCECGGKDKWVSCCLFLRCQVLHVKMEAAVTEAFRCTQGFSLPFFNFLPLAPSMAPY